MNNTNKLPHNSFMPPTVYTLISITTRNSSLLNKTTAIPDVIMKEKEFSPSEKVAFTVGLVVLIILTIFGNILVLGAFHQYRPLKTVTNYFIVSLSVADMLVAVISMPIWIVYVNVNFDIYKLTIEVYRAWVCLDILTGVSSVLNLTFVSVDRYLHISAPMHYQTLITSKKAIYILGGIWFYATILAMIKGVFWDWTRPNYEILISVLGFLLPLIVMGYCYYKMFGTARYHAKKMEIQTPGQGRAGRVITDKGMKTVKTIAVVVLAFFICWSPFMILNLIYGLCLSCNIPSALVTFSKWLHYANSALNPLIYACLNRDYRTAFRTLLTRRMIKKTNGNLEELSIPLRTLLKLNSPNIPSEEETVIKVLEMEL